MDCGEQNPDLRTCPLCKLDAHLTAYDERDRSQVRCDRCGEFQITEDAMEFRLPHERDLHLLSGVTREHWERNHRPLLITAKRIDELKQLAPSDTDVPEKARRLLLALGRRTAYPGSTIQIDSNNELPIAYAKNGDELRYYFRYLKEQNLADVGLGSIGPGVSAVITPRGWAAIEAYKTPNMESDKVFVAMWFQEEMNPAFFEGIEPAIQEDCGYKAIRIDTKDFIGDIVDEIIAEIRESRFVVADVTGQRQGVYFEAGYAQGMGLPVVWTCRNDEINKVHFDTRQQNHIVWETPEQLRGLLANRVRAVIGRGPHKEV